MSAKAFPAPPPFRPQACFNVHVRKQTRNPGKCFECEHWCWISFCIIKPWTCQLKVIRDLLKRKFWEISKCSTRNNSKTGQITWTLIIKIRITCLYNVNNIKLKVQVVWLVFYRFELKIFIWEISPLLLNYTWGCQMNP